MTVLLSGVVLASAARIALFLPAVQEWRLSRASLGALVEERGQESNDARLLYHIGLRLNRQERFAEAESNLRRAVGLDPDSARLRDEWARSLVGIGEITEAFNQLRQFVGTHPDSAPGHLILGKFYFTQRSMERAREEFERTVALAPANAEGWAFLARAASQFPGSEKPLEAARRAVALAPKNAEYRLLLASLLSFAAPAEAGAEYARAAELAPDNALVQQQYAAYLAENRRDPEGRVRAEAAARRALALNPKDGATHLLLGRLLQDTGRAKEAVAPLKEAAALSENDPSPAQALAQVHQTLGDDVEAKRWRSVWQKRQKFVSERDALYQQLRATPGARPLHAKLAHLFGTHGDVEGSLRNHATALRRAPDAPQTLVAAARDLTAGGFPERALLLAERAVAQGPRSPDAREALGDALLNLGRMDEAIANYNYTTNYVPSRAPAIQARVNRYAAAHPQPLSPAEKAYREALGLVEGQIGLSRTPARALELAEKANELDPGNITYLRLLLRLQFGARKMPEAIKTAEQVAQIAPDDAVTQALLAVMLVEFAKESADFARVESYLDAAKNAPEAAAQWHYGTGLLALRRGDGARAAAALTEAARLDPAADITFYKLAQAEQMRGRKEAAAKAMAEYQRRQKLKEEEFGLQGDISQHPDRPAVYEKLAAFYEKHQRLAEARAIREAARRRFSSGTAGAKAASAVNHKPSEKRERGQSK